MLSVNSAAGGLLSIVNVATASYVGGRNRHIVYARLTEKTMERKGTYHRWRIARQIRCDDILPMQSKIEPEEEILSLSAI